MAKLRRGKFFDTPRPTHDQVKSADLRVLVREICDEEGITPPGWVAVLGSESRRSNAMTIRFWRKGSGFLIITPGLFEDLNDDERRFVLRHELVHYRHGESRWAFLQLFAFLSPVLVVVLGNPINDIVGPYLTVFLYVLALVLHTLAFRSKRFFERRADREAIKSSADALVAKRALLKVSTVKRRHAIPMDEEQQEQVLADFECDARQPANFSLRAFNEIWGTHPLVQERLATYERLAKQGSIEG